MHEGLRCFAIHYCPVTVHIMFRAICRDFADEYQTRKKPDTSVVTTDLFYHWDRLAATKYALRCKSVQPCWHLAMLCIEHAEHDLLSMLVRHRFAGERRVNFFGFLLDWRCWNYSEENKLQLIKDNFPYISPRNHLTILRTAIENKHRKIQRFYAELESQVHIPGIPLCGEEFSLRFLLRDIYSREIPYEQKASKLKKMLESHDHNHAHLALEVAKLFRNMSICNKSRMHYLIEADAAEYFSPADKKRFSRAIDIICEL